MRSRDSNISKPTSKEIYDALVNLSSNPDGIDQGSIETIINTNNKNYLMISGKEKKIFSLSKNDIGVLSGWKNGVIPLPLPTNLIERITENKNNIIAMSDSKRPLVTDLTYLLNKIRFTDVKDIKLTTDEINTIRNANNINYDLDKGASKPMISNVTEYGIYLLNEAASDRLPEDKKTKYADILTRIKSNIREEDKMRPDITTPKDISSRGNNNIISGRGHGHGCGLGRGGGRGVGHRLWRWLR